MEAVKKIEFNKILKVISIALFGTLLLTISAKVKIPFYPVPMTMQTFMVMFLGIALGPRIAILTVSLYLFEGIFGLPVFAGTPEKGVGFIYFTGPTMGYLVGFLIASYIAGIHSQLKVKYPFKFLYRDNNYYLNIFFTLLLAVSFIYLLGLLWLGTIIGWDKPIFKLGAQPFLLAELFKLILLTVLYPFLIKIRKIT